MSGPTEVEDIASTPQWECIVPLGSRSPWVGGGSLGRRTLGHTYSSIWLTPPPAAAARADCVRIHSMSTGPPNLPPPPSVTILNHMSRRGSCTRTSLPKPSLRNTAKGLSECKGQRYVCRLYHSAVPNQVSLEGTKHLTITVLWVFGSVGTDQLNLTPASR